MARAKKELPSISLKHPETDEVITFTLTDRKGDPHAWANADYFSVKDRNRYEVVGIGEKELFQSHQVLQEIYAGFSHKVKPVVKAQPKIEKKAPKKVEVVKKAAVLDA